MRLFRIVLAAFLVAVSTPSLAEYPGAIPENICVERPSQM